MEKKLTFFRVIIAIILHVISIPFIYIAFLLPFFAGSATHTIGLEKFGAFDAVLFGYIFFILFFLFFAVPGAALLVTGFIALRFDKWNRDLATVLLIASGLALYTIFVPSCWYASAAVREAISRHSHRDGLDSYAVGLGFNLIMIIAAGYLLWFYKRKETKENEASRGVNERE